MTQFRLNKYIARASGVSRREADDLINSGKVMVDGSPARVGEPIDSDADIITINGKVLTLPRESTVLMVNKPVGYICSRNAQARDSKTIYAILPSQFSKLKTIGRLDKDSSGLILLTDDGDLAFRLTHPKFFKTKIYQVKLDRSLAPLHQQMISDLGITLEDGISNLSLDKLNDQATEFQVTMHEGRNRQIRRTFSSLGYKVIKLHRTNFDNYALDDLKSGKWKLV